MQALLDEWMALRNRPLTLQNTRSVHERTSRELRILKALLNAGCLSIPGEASNVPSLIQDRERSLQAAVERLTRPKSPR